jgi:4-amino-4-deoxy-L-arabinose transferase-like glycosyltransferase
MSTRFARILIVAVIVASAGVYLFGNGSVALWDRDEPRYAQTSRQMLASGDWVVPHYLDMIRTAKPAAIYWCQAAAMSVFGVNSFAARFPSSASIVILLVVLAIVLWKYADPQRAAWTVFVLATAALTIASAKMCITDALLLLWVTISQICLYAAWRGRATWPVVIVWAVAVGLAGLTKGPVVLGMQITTLIALGAIWAGEQIWNHYFKAAPEPRGFDVLSPSPGTPAEGRGEGDFGSATALDNPSHPHPNPPGGSRRIPSLLPDYRERGAEKAAKVFLWLLIVTAVVLPWILMVNHRAVMAATNSQSGSFIGTQVKHEVWDRMMTPLEQHSGPPGYYFLAVWATFFPWSLLLPLAVASGFVRRADPR